jgi:uncharacterized tellurite resistance protein B-like protein
MLDAIKAFIDTLSPEKEPSEQEKQHAIELATSVLMVEMCRIDGQVNSAETSHLRQLLEHQFELTTEEKNELMTLAENALDESTDYFQFTAILNQHYSQQEKIELIGNLWQIAFVDGKADSHESHLLRKLASLLHVSHKDFIRAKHQAEQDVSR